MRVLHVITSLQTGGAEAMLAKVVQALPAPRHSHVVITLLGGPLTARLRESGAEVVDLDLPRSAGALLGLRKLRAAAKRARPDVVQGWMYHGNLAASLAAGGRPVLWNVRQTLSRLSDTRPLTRAVILGCLPFAPRVARILYNADLAAAQHEKLGYPRAKRLLVPNGFDTETFRPRPGAGAALRALLGLPAEALVVGRVARDDAIKDHATLFDAFARIAAAEPRAHLACIGKGMVAEAPQLSALVARHGLSGRVHLVGERLDLDRLTPGFDVALSTSCHSEGFSNAIAEAMACAVPTVATDVGEAAAILGDPSCIVPPRDASAIAARTLEILAMPEEARRALGAQGRERVIAHYALPRIADRYAGIWQDVVADFPPRPETPVPGGRKA